MSGNSEVLGNHKDKSDNGWDILKWIAALLLVFVGFFAYHYFAEYPAVYRALALIPVIAIALFILTFTIQGALLVSLLREAVIEIRRVVWPTKQEALQTTLVVVAVVVLMSLVLWGLDAVFSKLVSLLIG